MSNTDGGERYLQRLTFHPDTFAVIQASAAENRQLAMRDGDAVWPAVDKIINQDEPCLIFAFPKSIGYVADMVEQYGERTDYATTEIAMAMPYEIASSFVEDRQRAGSQAEAVVALLRREQAWLESLPESPETFDAGLMELLAG